MKGFRIHTGQLITGSPFRRACRQVAQDWRDLAHAIREENDYASHVTEAQKDSARDEMLRRADEIEKGEIDNLTIWQRVNTALTGECVALLSK